MAHYKLYVSKKLRMSLCFGPLLLSAAIYAPHTHALQSSSSMGSFSPQIPWRYPRHLRDLWIVKKGGLGVYPGSLQRPPAAHGMASSLYLHRPRKKPFSRECCSAREPRVNCNSISCHLVISGRKWPIKAVFCV